MRAVLASMKVRNLKANHNAAKHLAIYPYAVLASVKVRNLKANHNCAMVGEILRDAVLASMKVRNLEAHRNRGLFTTAHLVVITMDCWSAHR